MRFGGSGDWGTKTMLQRFAQATLHVLKMCVATAICLMVVSHGDTQRASAAAASPFSAMAGPWRGSGTVTLKGGTRERVRCRASYDVNSGRDSLRQQLRCASDSYKFEIRSNVLHRNGAISGQWSEPTQRVAGKVVGTAKGARINARISSDLFTALVAVATRGNSQHVTISSPGSKLERVTITLRRAR